eukprot:CAMPEP_0171117384 /NCGR_PEP_ID=MMETSP0766_2-20121228/92332_1 /TAXON_ID=439317 /ORGANISM="Gambierdiscus australes, Strain CAWD 149" /LENGTH=56 /DNA_ID=CAMNT_0011579887 /DNA_START=67 /DNA_END=237 /DNA_ORIENTATION=-
MSTMLGPDDVHHDHLVGSESQVCFELFKQLRGVALERKANPTPEVARYGCRNRLLR